MPVDQEPIACDLGELQSAALLRHRSVIVAFLLDQFGEPERMWANGKLIVRSPTIDQAINGGHPSLEIQRSHRQGRRGVDLAPLPQAS